MDKQAATTRARRVPIFKNLSLQHHTESILAVLISLHRPSKVVVLSLETAAAVEVSEVGLIVAVIVAFVESVVYRESLEDAIRTRRACGPLSSYRTSSIARLVLTFSPQTFPMAFNLFDVDSGM